MKSALVWLGAFLFVGGYEVYTLHRSDDLHQPLTWHLRRLAHRRWLLILGITFWVWLPGHLAGWWL